MKTPTKKPKLMPKPRPKLTPKPKAKPKDREALPGTSYKGVILFAQAGQNYASQYTN